MRGLPVYGQICSFVSSGLKYINKSRNFSRAPVPKGEDGGVIFQVSSSFVFRNRYSPNMFSFLCSVSLAAHLHLSFFYWSTKRCQKGKWSSLCLLQCFPLRKTTHQFEAGWAGYEWNVPPMRMEASWSEQKPVSEPWHCLLTELCPSVLCFLALSAKPCHLHCRGIVDQDDRRRFIFIFPYWLHLTEARGTVGFTYRL